MAKKVDRAGIWLIEGNPLSKEGVYPYSGKVIDPQGLYGLDPDALYPVYRPKEELAKACASFNGREVRMGHEMIGDGPGLTPADSSVGGGTVFNVRMNPNDDSEMIGDLRIAGGEIRHEIESGVKQLSLGYFCKYRKEHGEFNGKAYDFVQFDLEGNHVAVVKEGRMGSSVRVFDSLTFDSVEITQMPDDKKKQEGGVREEIAKMLEGKDEDVLKAVKDAVEQVLNPDKPEGEDEDDPKKADGKTEGKDEDKDAKKKAEDDPCPHCGTELGLKQKGKDKDEEDPEGEDEDEEDGDGSKGCGDKAMDMKEVMREIAKRDRIADGVADIIGAFDHSEMTVEEVATYACDKLELPKEGDCVARIEGYISAHAKAKQNFVAATAEDSAEESGDFVNKYLNGK